MQWINATDINKSSSGDTITLPTSFSSTNYQVYLSLNVSTVYWNANTITPQYNKIDEDTITFWCSDSNILQLNIFAIGY